MLKHIRLYEEYTESNDKSLEEHHPWQEVRDTIQSKLTFVILDFKTEDDMNRCIKEELFDDKFSRQSYHLTSNIEDKLKTYHSIFVFDNTTNELSKRAKELIEKYDLLRLIISEYGDVKPTLYVGGSQVDIGENLLSGIDLDTVGGDDYYTYSDSQYYAFID